jgi:hypothetical protein
LQKESLDHSYFEITIDTHLQPISNAIYLIIKINIVIHNSLQLCQYGMFEYLNIMPVLFSSPGLQQQRAITEQLRREAAMQRLPVSQAVSDIIKYVTEHEQEDCLLIGFSSQKVNPFREKSSCSIL